MNFAIYDNNLRMPAPHGEDVPPVDAESPTAVPRLEMMAKTEAAQEPIALSGIVDAILEVSRQRKLLLDELRFALQSDKNDEALQLARKLCGLQG